MNPNKKKAQINTACTKMTNEKLEKILVINDDADEIAKLKSILPDDIAVKEVTQYGASLIKRLSQYDMIILDNDANEAKESKGKKTLSKILKKKANCPVIYTSHTPDWVADEVKSNSKVIVVKTEDLPKYLAAIHGVPVKQVEEQKQEGKTSVIITYNTIYGYKPGIYDNGKLLIISNTTHAMEEAPEVTQKNLEKIFGTFDIRNDKDKIKDIYVYVGLHAIKEPLNLACSLAHDTHKQVYVMACHCDWQHKQYVVGNRGMILHQVRCGGDYDLMKIADNILGRDCGKKIKEKK
jgi:CheY-like chemotaxis protein